MNARSLRWTDWIPPLWVALVTFSVFQPSLHNQFVDWDDHVLLVTNFSYRGLSPAHLKWMFTNFRVSYIPLTWLTFGVDYLIWGMNPMGYHLTNVLLHVLNAVLFYFLAFRLFGMVRPSMTTENPERIRLAAGAAALLFAIHPLRVESVAWAIERKDVLSGFFFLLTIIAYLKSRYRQALLFYLASLLSKPMGLMLPVVLLILDVYPLRRPLTRKVWLEKVPFVVLALLAGAAAAHSQMEAGASASLASCGISQRLAIMAYGLAFYVRKTLLPFNLSTLYALPPSLNPFDKPFLWSGLFVIGASAGIFFFRKRWPGLVAAGLCYAALLAPVSGILQSGRQIAADRFSYLPCLGWALVAGGALLTGRKILRVIGLGVIVGLGFLTVRQVKCWRDPLSLWTQAVQVDPSSALAQSNLGRALRQKGDFQGASVHIQEAMRLDPQAASYAENMGQLFLQTGKKEEAKRYFQQALQIDPHFASANNNLGVILLSQGRRDEAIRCFTQALADNPVDFTNWEIHSNLGSALAMQGQYAEAIKHFRLALERNPSAENAQRNLKAALALQRTQR